MADYQKFKKINELCVQGRMEEARRMLMELQARYIALCDEITMLKQQIQEFENIFFLSRHLIPEARHYWLHTGSVRHGPFCKPCYDAVGKLIRLEEHASVLRCSYCGLLHAGTDFSDGRPGNGAFMPRGRVIPFSLS